MKEPLVSVIITSYNAEKFIIETLKSVFNQTYKNWELIIVDDCSKDATIFIIEKFFKNSSNNILLLKNSKNLGSESRNVGIKHAKGKYLAFIDHDDQWLPQKLEKQVKFQEITSCPLSCTYYRRFNHKNLTGKLMITPEVITYKELLVQNTIGFSTVMVNYSIIKNFKMIGNDVSDYVTWLHLLKNDVEIQTLKEDLMRYYYNRSTNSGNKFMMAKKKWFVLRSIENLSIIYSVFIMFKYIFRSLLKYRSL